MGRVRETRTRHVVRYDELGWSCSCGKGTRWAEPRPAFRAASAAHKHQYAIRRQHQPPAVRSDRDPELRQATRDAAAWVWARIAPRA